MEKHVNLSIALFALVMILSTQVTIRNTEGEASPVTCVVITNPVEHKLASNYTVTVSPASARVLPGDTATFDVIVRSKDNVPKVISLDIVGLPKGISAAFDPAKGTTDFTSKLTIKVDEMMCAGVYVPSIVARDTNRQLADFKLEVAGAGSVREALENKITELNGRIAGLNARIDDLERTIRENQSNIFAGYVAILLVAIIGSFLLGAFALFVLLRNGKAKNSRMLESSDLKLQEIIDLLKNLIEPSRKLPAIKGEVEPVTKKEQQVTEPKVGDVWYAFCPICGLRTEHGRDYEGIFCARCGNRST